MDKKQYKYILAVVGQCFLYGTMDVVAKVTFTDISVYFFLTLRYLITSGLMFILWHKDIVPQLKNTNIKKYIIPSVCTAASYVSANIALKATAATNVSFIRSLTALIVPLLSFIFFKKKYGKFEAFVQVFILSGLYLLCAKGGLSKIGFGEAVALGSAVLSACSLVFGRRSLEYVSVKTLSFMQAFSALVICFVVAISNGSFKEPGNIASAKFVLSLIYSSLFCSFFGFVLQNLALTNISASIVGMVQCLYPVMASVTAFIVLKEKLSPLGFAGAVIITLCVLSVSIYNEKTSKQK